MDTFQVESKRYVKHGILHKGLLMKVTKERFKQQKVVKREPNFFFVQNREEIRIDKDRSVYKLEGHQRMKERKKKKETKREKRKKERTK